MMMDGKRVLRWIRLENVLSYGSSGAVIDLLPLNVLIGPNGSGKSNLVEAISVLKAAPIDVLAPIRSGGGIGHWLWKGPVGKATRLLSLEVGVNCGRKKKPLAYGLRLRSVHQSAEVANERIVDEEMPTGRRVRRLRDVPQLYYSYSSGHAEVLVAGRGKTRTMAGVRRALQSVSREDIDPSQSVLAQLRGRQNYPEITYLADVFSQIALFRTAVIGRDSPVRGPQPADESAAFLQEDGRNMGVVLSALTARPPMKKELVKQLQWLLPWAEDIATKVVAGTVEVLLHERALVDSIPATRLSDGTLRYLCLLAILCHPEPPPLVCLEDPEIGLHPDVLPRLADLLIEASQRMQLIVTTHSDILVSALSEVPEAVVVCERDDEGTHLRRLDKASLDEWLKKYSLGELWITGELGGTP
jgi:predicted ATPase